MRPTVAGIKCQHFPTAGCGAPRSTQAWRRRAAAKNTNAFDRRRSGATHFCVTRGSCQPSPLMHGCYDCAIPFNGPAGLCNRAQPLPRADRRSQPLPQPPAVAPYRLLEARSETPITRLRPRSPANGDHGCAPRAAAPPAQDKRAHRRFSSRPAAPPEPQPCQVPARHPRRLAANLLMSWSGMRSLQIGRAHV